MRNRNLLFEVDRKNYAENLIRMKSFHNFKCKTYAHERLNILRGVIRNKELGLATPKEIQTALGKQGVSNFKRIIIRRNGEVIKPTLISQHSTEE